MTSHWQQWVGDESIPENSRVTPSLLYIRIFHTPHFLHSSFSTLLVFCTPHFLHSANYTLCTPRIAPNPILATIFSIKVLFPLSNRPQKQRKAFFQALLEVLEFTPNTILVNDFYCGPKARSGACTAVNRLFSRSVVVAAWPVQRRFAHRGKFQGSFKSRSTVDTNDKLMYSTIFARHQHKCFNGAH